MCRGWYSEHQRILWAHRLSAIAVALASALLWPADEADAQQCVPVSLNQTCINTIFLSGGAIGLEDTGTLTVTNTNSGTISGSMQGNHDPQVRLNTLGGLS